MKEIKVVAVNEIIKARDQFIKILEKEKKHKTIYSDKKLVDMIEWFKEELYERFDIE